MEKNKRPIYINDIELVRRIKSICALKGKYMGDWVREVLWEKIKNIEDSKEL